MFLWFPVLDLARAPRRTARKKGSGYENGVLPQQEGRAWERGWHVTSRSQGLVPRAIVEWLQSRTQKQVGNLSEHARRKSIWRHILGVFREFIWF